jgi:hypothetical protein
LLRSDNHAGAFPSIKLRFVLRDDSREYGRACRWAKRPGHTKAPDLTLKHYNRRA